MQLNVISVPDSNPSSRSPTGSPFLLLQGQENVTNHSSNEHPKCNFLTCKAKYLRFSLAFRMACHVRSHASHRLSPLQLLVHLCLLMESNCFLPNHWTFRQCLDSNWQIPLRQDILRVNVVHQFHIELCSAAIFPKRKLKSKVSIKFKRILSPTLDKFTHLNWQIVGRILALNGNRTSVGNCQACTIAALINRIIDHRQWARGCNAFRKSSDFPAAEMTLQLIRTLNVVAFVADKFDQFVVLNFIECIQWARAWFLVLWIDDHCCIAAVLGWWNRTRNQRTRWLQWLPTTAHTLRCSIWILQIQSIFFGTSRSNNCSGTELIRRILSFAHNVDANVWLDRNWLSKRWRKSQNSNLCWKYAETLTSHGSRERAFLFASDSVSSALRLRRCNWEANWLMKSCVKFLRFIGYWSLGKNSLLKIRCSVLPLKAFPFQRLPTYVLFTNGFSVFFEPWKRFKDFSLMFGNGIGTMPNAFISSKIEDARDESSAWFCRNPSKSTRSSNPLGIDRLIDVCGRPCSSCRCDAFACDAFNKLLM